MPTGEQESLLRHPSDYGATQSVVDERERDDIDIDVPVHLTQFRANIRQCKAALVLTLSAALGTGIWHLTRLPAPRSMGGAAVGWFRTVAWSCELATIVLTCISIGLLVMTLIRRPFPHHLRPADLGFLINMGLHRTACVWIFISMLVAVILHYLPGVTYTLTTKRGAPSAGLPSWLHISSLLASLLASGLMRRGPLLCAEIAVSAFGLSGVEARQNGDSTNGKTDGDLWDDKTRPEVIDYGNSSMIKFLALGYSLQVAGKSITQTELKQKDLPLLEEWVRTSGDEYLRTLGPRGDHFTPYTSMQLVAALWKNRGWAIIITFLLESLNTVIAFVQIAALQELIASFKKPQEDYSYAYLMCWGLFFGQVVEVLLSAYLWVRENYVLHNPVRMTLSAILYAKILRSTDAKAMEAQNLSEEDTKAGKGRAQVMNLLTIDTNTVASMATYVWGISNGLLRLAIGLWFLYGMLGASAIAGLLCVPLIAPLSVWISKKIYVCDKAWARARDARIGAIKEFLMGIKVIKLNAFEEYEIERIGRLRDIETKWQRWRYTLGTLFNIVADEMPNVVVLVTFVVYTKFFGHRLEPETAFTTITIFYRVREGLEVLPRIVDILLSTKIALDRLKGYLNQDEVVLDPADVSEGAIILSDATMTWPRVEDVTGDMQTPDSERLFEIRDVSLTLPRGKMTLICGPLGSGKTLLLRSLLGETKLVSGRIVAPRSAPDLTPLDASLVKFRWTNELWLDSSIAYAPQMPYIRHGTVRDNITFGQPFWQDRYDEVLRQCSLESDLELLVDGDLTEVGENGVNLSGGQKARINLARCVYSRARTIYLDDILSAVDAHTARFIVDECFKGPLLRGRTVVLVSHHVDLCLPVSEFVVALSNGKIEQACPSKRAHVGSLIALASPKQEAKEDEEQVLVRPAGNRRSDSLVAETQDILHTLERESHRAAEPGAPPMSPSARSEDRQLYEDTRLEDDEAFEEAEVREARHLYKAEDQKSGHVAGSHYWMMIKAAGGLGYWTIFAIFYILAKGSSMVVQWVLKIWTADPDASEASHLDYYLSLYLAVNVVYVLFGSLRWIWLYGVGNVGWYSAGTKKIHRKLFRTIAQAPLSFFESVPSGRLLNVFAQDMRRLDAQSADDFGRTVQQVITVVGAAGVVVFEVPILFPVMIAFGIPLFMIANGLGKLRSTLRRLAAVADSPLISLYHDSIDGVVMLRAFGLPNLMAHTMVGLINKSRTAETWNWIVYNWVRGVVLSGSSVFITSTAIVLVGRDIGASQAGFILTFAAQISANLFGLLEQLIMLEQTFVSAERVNYYLDEIPQEPERGLEPPASWPLKGKIEIKDMSLRYAPDLPDVLHNINLVIEPGQRVGIVGATGSGKSTLALSLFRANEPRSGLIKIDGLDISTLSLQALRSRLNMVVQEGSLPSGTLRNALDVSGQRSDEEILSALRRVHLIPSTPATAIGTSTPPQSSPFANLDTFVAVEGANFSHGQRQLLCLARALLKPSKVLIMDEATSSCDYETDALITETLKKDFAGITMLVIAHRLRTIIEFDKIVVLDQGRIVEEGPPEVLLDMPDKKGRFKALCAAQGREEFDRLVGMARARNAGTPSTEWTDEEGSDV